MAESEVIRTSITRRFLDKRRNPWEYVDEELPTKTTKIFSRDKLGTIIDTKGTSYIGSRTWNVGSMHFSGSYYETSPGTYSFRVLRRSVYIGSIVTTGVECEWRLRHSREGTVDIIPFYMGPGDAAGSLGLRRPADRRSEVRGGPMNPIYAFGPGTLWTYFRSIRGTARVYSSLEGVF